MKNLLLVILLFSLTSCFSNLQVVGEGSKGTTEITEKNHYLVDGLIKLKQSDTNKMADTSQNYTIHTRITFVDGLLWFFTVGIYTPTTTTITK